MRSDNVMAAFAHFRTKTNSAIASGQEIEMDNTVNAPYEAVKIYGKSEQKAQWNQAEGVTSQVVTTDGQGKNKFDKSKYLKLSDYTLPEGATYTYAEIPLESNKTYTVSVVRKDGFDGTGYGYLLISDTSGINNNFTTIAHQTDASTNNSPYTVYSSGKLYIGYHPAYPSAMTQEKLDYIWEHTDVQIEEGTTATTYEDYVYDSPSPSHPSELTSNIHAGSYQIPTENGIYEVTLTEDLRGLDDAYRDKICFDSLSGKGYLEQNTLLVRMTRANLTPYRNTSDVTYRFIGTSAFAKYLPKTNANAAILCNRLKRYHLTSELLANDIVGVSNYTESGMAYNNVYIFLSKSDIGITADDTADTMQEKAYTYLDENPLYILVGGYSYREELTFTKVESSTLPVLPLRVYGNNLVTCNKKDWTGLGNFNVLTMTGNVMSAQAGSGGTTRFVFRQKFEPGTYTANAIFSSFPRYIIRLYDSSGNLLTGDGISGFGVYNTYYKGFTFDASTITFTTPSVAYSWDFAVGFNIPQGGAVGDIVTVSNVQLESGQETSPYEPFNPTPPESITPSPDYPHQIYDLSNVMIKSRGRNLFDAEDFYQFYRTNGNTDYMTTAIKDGRECLKFRGNAGHVSGKYLVYPFDGKKNTRYTFRFVGSQDVVGAGYSSGIGFHYSDGTTSTLPVENSTEWTEKTVQTPEGKTLVGLSLLYNYGNWGYMSKDSIVMYEGVYTEENHPPYDRYRNTSATVPIALKSCGEDADYLLSDGQTVKRYQYIRDIVIDGTLNNFVCNVVGSTGDPRCQFYVKNNTVSYDCLKQGSVVKTSHGFATQAKADGANYLPYLIFPWEVLGITTVPTVAEANEAAKAYCAEQNALGMPLIMRYVLYTPVETKITDTWAQNMLALKTAPYYTKLHADKETGGLKARYPSIKKSNEESSIEYLLTSSQEYVITSDEKTVILF